MFLVWVASYIFAPLPSHSKLHVGSPNVVQVCLLPYIAPGRACSVARCVCDRMSCHLCETPFASLPSWWALCYPFLVFVSSLSFLGRWITYLHVIHHCPFSNKDIPSFWIKFTKTVSVNMRWRSFTLSFLVGTSTEVVIWCCISSPSSYHSCMLIVMS